MSNPRWLNKKETPRKFSQKREKLIAKKLNADLTPNSGARWHSKADLETENALIEIKSTTKDQIVIHKGWLEKIRNEALKQGKEPILVIDFGSISISGLVEK